MSAKRIGYIDALKVFAIFMVVWAHLIHHFGYSVLNENIHVFIYSFHMPLFAFISGYFLTLKRGWWKSVLNKSVRLGVPLIFWCTLWTIVSCIFVEKVTEFHFLALLKNIYYNIAEWDLWYLRALLLSFIAALSSMAIFKKKCLGLIISYVLFQSIFLGGLIPEENAIIEFYGFIFLYPFVCMGVVYRYYETMIEKYEKYLLFVFLGLYGILLCFWNVKYTFYHTRLSMFSLGNFSNPDFMLLYITFFRFLIGGVATMAFYLLFKSFKEKSFLKSSLLVSLSNATLCIYIVHYIYVIHGLFPNFMEIEGWCAFYVCLLSCLLIVSVCYYIYILTSKSKMLSFLLWGEI